jgi:hypothetical protein
MGRGMAEPLRRRSALVLIRFQYACLS